MTTTESKPSTLVSAFAAVMCLTALPLGLLVFTLNVESVAEAWNEGGWPMYLVFLCAFLACGVNATGAFFLPRGSIGAAAAGIFLSLACGAIGAFGFRFNLNGADAAIAYANPMDQGIIMHGALGESLMCVVFGFSMAGASFLMLGIGGVVGAGAGREQRAALGIFGAGSIALGLWQFAVSHVLGSEASAYKAVAHAMVSDRMVLLAVAMESAQHARQLALVLLVPVLISAVASVMVLRGKPSLGPVTAGIVVPLLALAAMRVTARANEVELEMLKSSGITTPLRELNGAPVDWRDRVVLLDKKGLHAPDGTSPSDERPIATFADDGTLNVALTPDVSLEQLRLVLRQLAMQRIHSVRLVGTHVTVPPPGVTIPPPFDLQLTQLRGVRVLLANDDTCEEFKCEFGTLTGDKLMVGSESLPLVDESFVYDDNATDFARAIHLKLEGVTLEQVIKAAHTAGERRVALHL